MFFLIAVILTWFFQLFPQDKPPEQDRWIQEYEPFYNYLEVEQIELVPCMEMKTLFTAVYSQFFPLQMTNNNVYFDLLPS